MLSFWNHPLGTHARITRVASPPMANDEWPTHPVPTNQSNDSERTMSGQTVAIALPVADRHRSADFYRAFLERDPYGAIADDGLPEPLQFRINAATSMLLIPTGGFNWVLQDHRTVGAPTVVRTAFTWVLEDTDSVNRAAARAAAAGAETVIPPTTQPWQVFAGVIADPDGHLWVLQAGSIS